MILTLQEIAEFTGSTSPGGPQRISEWSIDTRTLPHGALYIALKGDVHDGHDFLAAAAAAGASAALVDDRLWPETGSMRLIRVSDTLAALQRLAAQARPRLRFPLVAVTGSAGKTTTKETIASLTGAAANLGNLNNHIGLPLSLLRLNEAASAAVLEMGMNHAGEIRFLAQIARPDIGVVTNVGTAHIEAFASIDGIALAKRELIEELGPAGHAVLNHDDPRVRQFASIHSGHTLTYGIEDGADIQARHVELHAGGATFRIDTTPFEIHLPGRHAISNVTAAVAVGSILGIPLAQMAEAARALKTGKMRGERIEHNGVTILNDCYNSNPEAAKAMLDTLAALPGTRKIAVLGEMLELGSWSDALHAEVGAHAAALGIDIVLAIRGAARSLAEAARLGGTEAIFFEESAGAGEALRTIARPGDVVLCKGSRGTRVEKALERFLAN